MARSLKTNNGRAAPVAKTEAKAAGNAGSNVAVRADIQRKAFQKLWELDREKKALVEQHITPLNEERSQVWKDLRNDLDMKSADLRPLYSLYKRDRELAEFEDEDEASKCQDALREAFETLRTGQMLDFLAVLESKPKGKGAEPVTVKTARAAGREAGRAGKSAKENPHGKGGDLHTAWAEGWQEAQAERAEEMRAPENFGTEPFPAA